MLRLYDTAARAVMPIEPAESGHLRIYACGPTVYRDAHVGNMRTFLLPDLIARTARARGLRVTITQNITDVGHMLDDTGLGSSGAVDEGQQGEDRMLAAADSAGGSALAIAREFEARFVADCERLGIGAPKHLPRASECIPLMIALIDTLIEKGHAYIGGDGSVYFDATSVSDYGAISGNRLDALKPGHRFEGGVDPNKRFHADWALWKRAPHTRTQLVWDTPWGIGFPGWHIECTAMLLEFLGESVDIHTGGIDLRFPHHEDERAQTNAAVGQDVVRHWVHGEHLLFEGRKMSKSAGNVVLVEDLVTRGIDPRALRLAFLQTHYRTQVDLSWAAVEAAAKLLRKWRQTVAIATWQPSHVDQRMVNQVLEMFEDDLTTASAIIVLRQFEKDESIDISVKAATLAVCDELLGLDLTMSQPATLLHTADVVPDDVAALLAQRSLARDSRDWAQSDVIRDELATLGWTVTDEAGGQSLRRSRN
jgi:cysteinyl-tRNA synthetase